MKSAPPAVRVREIESAARISAKAIVQLPSPSVGAADHAEGAGPTANISDPATGWESIEVMRQETM